MTHLAEVRHETSSYLSPSAGWYMVSVLLLASVLSYVDRQILVLLVEPIKRDLLLSDITFSLLQGFAFTILYSFLGLPLGSYVDHGNRRNLVVVGIALWSVMTVACGLAETYWQLFAARVGVGIGEAALAPAAYSLIADSFRPERRGAALGTYTSGTYLGIGLAVTLGGIVIAFIKGGDETSLPLFGLVRTWQAAFICVGLPGLLVALLVLTVPEPRRPATGKQGASQAEAWAFLRARKGVLVPLLLGYSLFALAGYGVGSWIPTMFIRVHGWSAPQAATYYGAAIMIMGTAGGILSGAVADRWLAKGRTAPRLVLTMLAALCWMPFIVGGSLVGEASIALVCFGGAAFFSSMANCLGPTAMHDIIPPSLRGQATAVFFFTINLLGLGIGPTAIALVTDTVFGSPLAVRWAMPMVAIPAILGGIGLLVATRRAMGIKPGN